MPTPDGIGSDDWNVVRDLVILVAAARTPADRSQAIRRLFAFLDDLERMYGTRPSILATRADFLDNDDRRVQMLEQAYSVAAMQSDHANMLFIAHSLAEFYLDDPPHLPNAQKWLARMERHLATIDHREMAANYQRLRARFDALGWT
ncbi:MAG TPA: hypothetical protein VH436_29120 [Vicinamibacterales bacterium]